MNGKVLQAEAAELNDQLFILFNAYIYFSNKFQYVNICSDKTQMI